MLNLADIKPGDEIEYEQDASRVNRAHIKISKGKVIQATDKTIAIQGERYPVSILINDLVSGQAKIISLRGEDFTMAKAIENKQELLDAAKARMDGGLNMSKTAKQIGVPLATLSSWLKQEKQQTPDLEMQQDYCANCGNLFKGGNGHSVCYPCWCKKIEQIEREKQTPDPEPVQVGRQEPDQEKEEPAVESLPEGEVPVKETQYKPSDNDFNPEDYGPISYRPTAFDLDKVKLNLIKAVLNEREIGNIPNNLTLALIGLIRAINQQRLVERLEVS